MHTENNLIARELNQLSPVFKDFPFLMENQHSCAADRADVDFMFRELGKVPEPIQRNILNKAFKLKNRQTRNLYILRTTKKITGLLPKKLQYALTVEDDDIRNLAKDCAERCKRISLLHNVTGRNSSLLKSEKSKKFCNVTELNPLTEICKANSSEIYRILSEFCSEYGVTAPKVRAKLTANSVTELGAISRMCEKGFWTRQLRKIFNQAYEQAAIELTLVNKHKQIYASDLTVKKRKQQKIYNENMLSSMKVINDVGQQFSLKELSDLNVSNPKVRKAELMVRMRGFEELSKAHNHQGLFITITCPSKYHAVHAKSGQRNEKYQSFTPYQANQYLCKVWSQIRAELERKNIKPYGFRVAEPQHDATPHWHMLLFVEKEQVALLQNIITHYALKEDGDEKGAIDKRCDFKLIDPKKGGATGYIAKYVSKNIDGKNLDKGVYGEDPITAAQRVDAWASCWNIRQFQQIGGSSVSVWRELRRLKQALGETLIEKARVAADNSKWHDYIEAMGGVFAKRKEQRLKLAYDVVMDTETGECKLSFHDRNVIQTIKGIYYKGQMIVTRFFSWRLERADAKANKVPLAKYIGEQYV